jgi:lipoate-protein ligase A
MALDEAIFEAVAAGKSPPTLRFYGWAPPAVSLGSSLVLEDEVDEAACRAEGVDVVRRISGGGAVFHHQELTYSIIMSESHALAAGQGIGASYETLCGGIIEGLAILGLEAQFQPVNDIIVGGKKVSGNAQSRRRGCILQHGTVLLGLDLDLMFRLLSVAEEKLRRKHIASARQRVTSLAALGCPLSFDEAQGPFVEGFRRALSLEFTSLPASPSPTEEARAQELVYTKFATPEWLQNSSCRDTINNPASSRVCFSRCTPRHKTVTGTALYVSPSCTVRGFSLFLDNEKLERSNCTCRRSAYGNRKIRRNPDGNSCLGFGITRYQRSPC